jgi:hypothetical protein
MATILRFVCPSCRHGVKVKSELADSKVKCRCGQKMLVPKVPMASKAVLFAKAKPSHTMNRNVELFRPLT